MKLFLGKHLGGGFVVGTHVGGSGGGGRKSNSSGVAGCLGVIGAILLGGLALWLTQNLVISLVLTVVGVLGAGIVAVRVGAQEALDAELAAISHRIQEHVDMIGEGNTLETRLSNCAKAIALVKEVQGKKLDPVQATATSRFLETLSLAQRVLPVFDSLQKAERAEFKGQKSKALDHYLDVLHECRAGAISDEDFSDARLRDDETGEIVTTDFILRKARLLGWDEGEVSPFLPGGAEPKNGV